MSVTDRSLPVDARLSPRPGSTTEQTLARFIDENADLGIDQAVDALADSRHARLMTEAGVFGFHLSGSSVTVVGEPVVYQGVAYRATATFYRTEPDSHWVEESLSQFNHAGFVKTGLLMVSGPCGDEVFDVLRAVGAQVMSKVPGWFVTPGPVSNRWSGRALAAQVEAAEGRSPAARRWFDRRP